MTSGTAHAARDHAVISAPPNAGGKGSLYGHIKKTKNRSKFLEFCRYLPSLYPATIRIAIVCDNYSPHLTTKRCRRVADWAEANNVEIAYGGSPRSVDTGCYAACVTV